MWTFQSGAVSPSRQSWPPAGELSGTRPPDLARSSNLTSKHLWLLLFRVGDFSWTKTMVVILLFMVVDLSFDQTQNMYLYVTYYKKESLYYVIWRKKNWKVLEASLLKIKALHFNFVRFMLNRFLLEPNIHVTDPTVALRGTRATVDIRVLQFRHWCKV